MKLPIFAFSLAAAFACFADEPKFEPLFNGKDLTNFKAEGSSEFWRAEDGVLVGENNADKKGNYLWTEKEYGDFVIEFDVRWKGVPPRGVDTGLEMRKPSIQLQLGVSGSLKVDMSGSWYVGKPGYPEVGQAKEAKTLMKPEGEWNTFRIQAKGDTFTCWINGTKASEYTDAKFSEAAPLGFQIHPGVEMKCEYKNIRIAPLDDDLKKIAAEIDGYRFEFPCKDPMPENPKPGADGISARMTDDPATNDKFTDVRKFGGEAGKRYKVTLRVRGVVEPMMYKDGQQEGERFYIGGTPNNATYNIYQLTVSSPASHYFFNRDDKVGHRIFTVDYTATLEIEGGATLTFRGDGQNGHMITNFAKLVVPEIPPAPKPFNGQFIQLNVLDVVEVK